MAAHTPESYWTYKAPPTPNFCDLPAGTFAGDENGWMSLAPGFRREIYRDAMKRLAPQQTVEADAERLRRADDKHRQSEVQINARESL